MIGRLLRFLLYPEWLQEERYTWERKEAFVFWAMGWGLVFVFVMLFIAFPGWSWNQHKCYYHCS